MKRAISFALSLSAALQLLMAADTRDRVCATCHPKETVRYLATAMGRSLVSPDPLPSGKVTHAASGSVISIEERDGRMLHTLSEGGLTAQYAIAYQIGGGLMARTYIMQIADTLLESPATWFNSYGWDLSPGYAQKPFI
ncbi:MAG: hypothetical protein JO211_07460, partial [Acidobacteriaceae bacterium]|nr:hypothetical protein [Acidobacteriaceae bacterium]